MTGDAETELRVSHERKRAEDWALVLVAEGMHPSIRRAPGGFGLYVPGHQAARATRALESYEVENPAETQTCEQQEGEEGEAGEVHRLAGFAVAAAPLAFLQVTGPRDPAVHWFASGSADAQRMLAGELERAVTALCLHADLGHALGNAIFGALFFSAVFRGFGVGVGVALILAAGAAGNLANALLQAPHHISVGAPTAVFGAVGLLCGRAAARRLRRARAGLRAWVPLAAGVALIAMLGTSQRSDLWAHLLGFAAGGFLGIPAALALPRRGGPLVQCLAGGAALGALLYCWKLALA
jgi:membrane associated rhomboid family serine protease